MDAVQAMLRVVACLLIGAGLGFVAGQLSRLTLDEPAPPDPARMQRTLDLSAGLVLNRAEMTLRTVDLQSLLVQEATSGQCSSGARFLLRQAMIENSVIRYAALLRDGELSCQPGGEDSSVLKAKLEGVPQEVGLLLLEPQASGRNGEAALIRFKETDFASVFWFPADRLVADPLNEIQNQGIAVEFTAKGGAVLARTGSAVERDETLLTSTVASSAYPIEVTLKSPGPTASAAPPPSLLWTILGGILASLVPLIWSPVATHSINRD